MSADALDPEVITAALEERTRLDAVQQVMALEIPVDQIQALLTSLADLLGGSPLCAVTVLDGTTQHFLATSDGPMADMEREVSHCQYVISTGEFICIRDASLPESRWSKLKRSLIKDEPLAAYLGFPLRFHDQTIGAVCAADSTAREWTAEQHFAVYQASRAVRKILEQAAGTMGTWQTS